MFSENLVSLLGSKGLTERVLIHTDAFRLSLSEESVEEGWSDPWLEDLPATNVGSNHGLVGESDRCESSESERFHLKN